MPALESGLRAILERAFVQARDKSEEAARAALTALAVDNDDAYPSLDAEQRRLRNALRARGRQLGGGSQSQGFTPLVEEVAYEQWHRMLFARFLAENNLLMHPEGAPVTLDECEELAAEEGEPDRWQVAAKYASRMLPGIFRADDPSVQVHFAPEGRAALERILAGLPLAVFTADDGLGWVYQFWQSKKKKEVNASGRKIGGADLAPVTQLFTEDYMVRFLLENSLGAWWAGRHPQSSLLKDFSYLRFKDDGTPAAGTFDGWPERVAEVTVMDPCCGSGHFLVVAFEMLRRMRMAEEGLSERDAADAVLRDNLFGLEIDARCVQIAAFALALAGWKVGGHRQLPALNFACSGIPVTGQLEEWTKLAGDDQNLRYALERLYELFKQAQDLGSLIDPASVPLRDRMFAPDFARVAPLVEQALVDEATADPVAAVFGRTAAATARAAGLLSRRYRLVTTNVPYLARGRQSDALKLHVERQHPSAKTDLATAFLERCRSLTARDGLYATVTPQSWLFLGSFKVLRKTMLNEQTWSTVVRLGSGAFDTIGGQVVNVALTEIMNTSPPPLHAIAGLDVSIARSPADKQRALEVLPPKFSSQAAELQNPDAVIMLSEAGAGERLSKFVQSVQGVFTGDASRFVLRFWEICRITREWSLYQRAPESTATVSGCTTILRWEDGVGDLTRSGQARIQGQVAWGKRGLGLAT